MLRSALENHQKNTVVKSRKISILLTPSLTESAQKSSGSVKTLVVVGAVVIVGVVVGIVVVVGVVVGVGISRCVAVVVVLVVGVVVVTM